MSLSLEVLLCVSGASHADSAAVVAALDHYLRQSLGALLRHLRLGSPELLGRAGSSWVAEERDELHQELLVYMLDKLPQLRAKAQAGQFHEGYLWQLLQNRLQQLRREAAPVASAARRRIRSSIRQQVAVGVMVPTHPADPSPVPQDVSFPLRQAVPLASREQLAVARDSFPEASRLSGQLANRGHRETRVLARFWAHLRASGVHRFLTQELCEVLVPEAPQRVVAAEAAAALVAPEASAPTDEVAARWWQALHSKAAHHPHRAKLLKVAEMMFEAAAVGLMMRAVDVARALGVAKQRASEWMAWIRATMAEIAECA